MTAWVSEAFELFGGENLTIAAQFQSLPSLGSSKRNYTGAIATSSVATKFGQTAALPASEIGTRRGGI
jgi:hypothetical protein